MALEPTKVLAFEGNLSRSHRINASDNVKDRGLSSTVRANESTDFASINVEVNFVQSCNATKFNGDILKFEKFL
jgi:hypothetical protein